MSKKDFENMSPKEIEDYFGVTQEQIEEWDDMLVRGEIPGVSVGEVVVGRPLKFGEHLRQDAGGVPVGDRRAHGREGSGR